MTMTVERHSEDAAAQNVGKRVPRHAAPPASRPWYRRGWDLLLVTTLLAIAGMVAYVNMANYPMRFVDEGVYVSQAWAVQTLGKLANYTYWYDHPPVGWVQLASWTMATDGFGRHAVNPLLAGREFMVLVRVVVCLLIYVLARRIGMRRLWASVALLLFALSPLSVQFGRYVFLDSIALPWLLGGFVLAYSPRRRIMAAVGVAICLTMAILTKETLAVAAPAVVYALWSNYRGSKNRVYATVTAVVISGLLVLFYPLYAYIKSEFFHGEGHVSLVDALQWQLTNRAGSGSVLDPSSDARNLAETWWQLDPWLLALGLAATLPAFFVRRLRPIVVAILIQLAMLVLRTGYLPFMYVIASLPFLALAIAGVMDVVWPRQSWVRTGRRAIRVPLALAAASAVLAAGVGFGKYTTPAWSASLQRQLQVDADKSQRDAVAWVKSNIPKDKRIIVEGESWLDYVSQGYTDPQVIWIYKVDTDPAVRRTIGDWQNIDYLVLTKETLMPGRVSAFPMVRDAIGHADVIQTFGTEASEVVVMKVRKDG